ncbi:MAG: hypothetical protein AMXMBFR64_54590 [Myxococcales bacterium]
MKTFATMMLALLVFAGCEPPEEGDLGDLATLEGELTSSELMNLILGGTYKITQSYQPNKVHAGIDIGGVVTNVTKVRSPVSGTITANTSACGKVAIFDGKNTFIAAHMSNRTTLPVGSAVKMGDYLGTTASVVGGGCSSTGTHLHVEFRVGNNTSLALPTADNTKTTLNPLTYAYPPFPAPALQSPASKATVNAKQATFSWLPIQGATSYRLQVGTLTTLSESCTGCAYNAAASTTSRTIAIMPGSYYWRVRAGNSGQGGAWSAARAVTAW